MLRNTRLVGGLLLLAVTAYAPGLAHAQMADSGAGKKRAAVCFACHSENGISIIPGTPNLAGQDQTYLANALTAYRGAQLRQDPTMTAMAKPLSDQDIANIAAYFSSLPRDGK